MDISNEIHTRLQNGEDIENIVADVTKSINTANETYITQKEAEAKAKKEALDQAALIADKRDAVIDFLDSICNICATWGVAEDLIDDIENVSDEDISDIVATLDQSIPFIAPLPEIYSMPSVYRTQFRPSPKHPPSLIVLSGYARVNSTSMSRVSSCPTV